MAGSVSLGVENTQTRYRRRGVMVLMSLVETGEERISVKFGSGVRLTLLETVDVGEM